MELLYVTVIAAAIGAIVRYTIPGRQWHGMLLLPGAAAVVCAVVWVALLWSGLTFDGGWIWTISLGCALLASLTLALLLPRLRAADDERLRRELGV